MSENDQTKPARSAPTPAPAPAAAPKKKKRRVLRFFLYLFVFLVLLVALLPTLISTSWGTNLALSFVNKTIPGSIEVDDLSVGWFSGASIEGLKIKDPEGKTIIAADMSAPSVKLFSLLTGSRQLGDITLTATTCEIIAYDDGTNNLSRAFGPGKEKEPPKDDGPASMPPDLSVKLTIKAAKATYAAPKMETATMSDFELVAEIKNPGDIAAKLGAKLAQGAYATDISLTASLKDAFDTQGKMQAGKSQVAVQAKVPTPSPMIDELGKQDGRVTALAGPLVTTQIDVTGSLAAMNVTLKVDAERMKVTIPLIASLTDDMKPRSIVIKPAGDGEIGSVTVVESAMTKLAPDAASLQKPFTVRAYLEKTDIIFQDGGQKPDMLATRASLRITSDPITVNTGSAAQPEISTLTIKSFALTYDGPGGKAEALIEAVATRDGKSGTLIVRGDVRKPLTKDGKPNWETLKVEQGSVEIRDFALSVLDDIAGTAGLFVGLLGDTLQAEGKLALTPSPDGRSASGTVDFTAKTDDGRLKVSLLGGKIEAKQVSRDGKEAWEPKFASTQPGVINFQWSQQSLNLLGRKFAGLKKLTDQIRTPDSALVVKINELSAPLGPELLKQARADIAVYLGPVMMDLNEAGQTNANLKITVRDTVATLKFIGQENKATITLNATALAGVNTGTLSADVNVANLVGADGKVNAKALAPVITFKATDMPTALADAFIGKGRLAFAALGPSINAIVNTTVTQVAGKEGAEALAGPVNIEITSQNATVNLAGQIGGGRMVFDDAKDKVTFTLTPELVTELKSAGMLKLTDDMKDLALAGATTVTLDVTQLDVPLDQSKLKTAKLGLVVSAGAITPVGDARLAGVSIPSLTAMVPNTTLGDGLSLLVSTQVKHGSETGSINADVKLAKLFNKEDKIDAGAASTDAFITITKLPTALVDPFIKKGKLGSIALGPTLDAKITAKLNRAPGKEGVEGFTGPVSIALDSANAKVALDGALAGGRLTIDEKSDVIRFAATPALIAELKAAGMLALPEESKNLSIAGNAMLTLDIKQLDVPLTYERIKTGKIGLTATIDRIEPTGDARLSGASVESLMVIIPNVTLDQPLNITLSGKLKQGAQAGNLEGGASVRNFFDEGKEKQFSGNISIIDAPTALIDALGNQGGFLAELFGPKISLLHASLDPNVAPRTLRALVKIESTTINGGGAIDLLSSDAGNRIAAVSADGKPALELHITLTPAAFAALQKKYGDKLPAMLKGMSLFEDTKVRFVVNALDLAMVKSEEKTASRGSSGTTAAAQTAGEPASPHGLPILAKESKLDIAITSNGPFLRKEGVDSALRLDNVSLAIKSGQDLSTLNLNLAADTMVVPIVGGQAQVNAAGEKGKLTSVTSVPGLANEKGRIDFSKLDLATVKTDTQITNLPTKDVVAMLNLKPFIGGAVGKIETATVKSGQDGALVINMKSDNMTANMVGTVKDNKVTLNEDAKATVKANDLVNEALLIPMFGGLLKVDSSEKPIEVKMFKEGFSMPVSGFSMKDVSSKMDINLGTMKVRPRLSTASLPKEAAALNGLLKLAGVDLEKGFNRAFSFLENNSPTFAPLDASLSNGVLKYNKPLSFTVDKYTFSLDGHVDLNTSTPKMTLNIPLAVFGDSAAAKLGKFLGTHFPLPLAGSIDKPTVDGNAVNKVMETIQKNLGKGLFPGLGGNDGGNPDIGGLLEGILGGKKEPPKEPPKNPPPPNQPNQPPPSNAQPNPNPPDANKKEEPADPLKDLLKGLLDRNKKKEEPKK